jgi:cell division transport system ATP-binding protein
MIRFEGVEKVYSGIIALKGIDLEFQKGEFVLVTGPTGAGKSTLLKLIYAQERPTLGRVLVLGHDVSRLKKKGVALLRRKLGMIFQDFKLLFDRSVYENVAFGLEVLGLSRSEVLRRSNEALSWVGLGHRRSAYPYELSGGEQQKVCLARALAKEPYILLADEPTGNIDQAGAEEVIQLLWQVNRAGTLVVMATHNEALIRFGARVVELKSGEIQTNSSA